LNEANQRGQLYVNPASIPTPTTGQVIAVKVGGNNICYQYTGSRSGIGQYTHNHIIDHLDCEECESRYGNICPVLAQCCNDPNITIVVGIDNTYTIGDSFLYNGKCYAVNALNAANGLPVIIVTSIVGTCDECLIIHPGLGC
jgi:hypothetical protein